MALYLLINYLEFKNKISTQKMLKKILKILFAITLLNFTINAQNLIFLDGKTEISAKTGELELVVSNTDTVSGIQATLKLDKPIIKIDTIIALRNNLLFKYYSPDSVTTNFVLLTNDGYEFKPGKTIIAKIKFSVLNFTPGDSVSINFENLLMIAPKVRRLNANANGITLKINKLNESLELKFNISYSSIVVSMRNNEKVKNLNIEFKLKEGSTAELVSLMPRSAGVMKLDYTIQNDIVRVNLHSKPETALEPGDGEIFFITGKFNSTNDIEISKIEVINQNGDILTPNFKLVSVDIYPASFKLEQNYPNPFNPATTIKFRIPVESRVQIAVFDINGRLVKVLVDDILPAGEHLTIWDGTDLNGARVSSGVYIYRMYADKFVEAKRMILIK